jgi:hypothetical protein
MHLLVAGAARTEWRALTPGATHLTFVNRLFD